MKGEDSAEWAGRVAEQDVEAFVCGVFARLGVPAETAALAARSLLDASLMGIDSHGVEALDMYVAHLRVGGLDPKPGPVVLREHGGTALWDMRDGFGLASSRLIMRDAMARAQQHGVCFATCRRTNHLGACGVYARMAAEEGLIAQVSQQTRATFAPPGGRVAKIGASPVAFAAPVAESDPFCFDATLASMTRSQMKALRRTGKPLPPGTATDGDGNPTTDPEAAWFGQILPIGGHKGVGLAMCNEVLHAVLAGGIFAAASPSIVSNPERTANTSIYMLVIDPEGIMPRAEFAQRMKEYVAEVESSPARDAAAPPRYPGRRMGERWRERRANGIPFSREGAARLREIAAQVGVAPLPLEC